MTNRARWIDRGVELQRRTGSIEPDQSADTGHASGEWQHIRHRRYRSSLEHVGLESLAGYERAFADPVRRHAMLQDYRAALESRLEEGLALGLDSAMMNCR